MAKVPWNRIVDVINEGKKAQESRSDGVRVCVRIAAEAPRQLVLAVKDAFVAVRRDAIVDVREAAAGDTAGSEPVDLAVIVCGAAEKDAASCAVSFVRRGTPVAFVVESAVEAPELLLPEETADYLGVIACTDPSQLGGALGPWVIEHCDKGIAFAASFPFCRKAEVDALITRCATENAGVGAINLIPGSDMPIMTANQAKLALDIAAAYGRGLEPSRALEIAAVVAAGFGWRSLSRSITSLVPTGAWVLRAVLGYAGTLVTGRAVEARFGIEDGTIELPFSTKPQVAADAVALLPAKIQRTREAGERKVRERVQEHTNTTGPGYVVFSADGSLSEG